MATIVGARTTLNVDQTLRKPDVATAVLELEPNAAPLTVITQRLNKRATVNPQFKWYEDSQDPRFDTVNGAVADPATTTVNVHNGAYFGDNDLILITRTMEVIRVTSVSTNALTVVRGIGGTTAAAILNSDEIVLIGNAFEEGAASKAARSRNPTAKSNYTQIFRTSVSATETQRHTDQFTQPNDWDRILAKKGVEHNKDKEYSFLLGGSAEATSGFTNAMRTTGGVLSYILTNQTAVGGALTEATFYAAMRAAFRYGSKNKTLFASALVVDAMNGFPRSKIQVPDQALNSYGVDVTRWVSPHGTLNLVTHWLLEGSKLGGYAIGLDMGDLAYRYLANEKGSRDTHVRENIQTPDVDARTDEYLSECGLEFGEEKKHFVLTGITG